MTAPTLKSAPVGISPSGVTRKGDAGGIDLGVGANGMSPRSPVFSSCGCGQAKFMRACDACGESYCAAPGHGRHCL